MLSLACLPAAGMPNVITLFFVILLAIICLGFSLSAKTAEQIEKTVRSVAENILSESSFKILNTKTGELFDVADKSSGHPADLKIESPCNEWKY